MHSKPKLIYVVTEDWYFCSHRLPLAKAAVAEGFEVLLATRVREHRVTIETAGVRLVEMDFRRGRGSFLADLGTLWRLFTLYRRERPVLVHHVALKPVLYGGLMAKLAGVPAIVNAFAGLGYVFTGDGAKRTLLRTLIRFAMRLTLKGRRSQVVVQNDTDHRVLRDLGISASQLHVIRGSGVDVKRYCPMPEPPGPCVVTMVSRVLWDKGVAEFVECARRLRRGDVEMRFRLVGTPDNENPASVDEQQIQAWADEGVIEWLGHRSDIANIWATSHLAVLPSYREGLPKSLLEAAACGRAIVTTDVPGCRDVVDDGVNGLLVPVKNVDALTDAVRTLVSDSSARQAFGTAGRERVVALFSDRQVIAETLGLYRQLTS